ncbi:MAG TPA: hypothetical protein GXX28_03395, partial [Firmicutes bacterium]|nr:hypothetical protein [Bacillota bacterium]
MTIQQASQAGALANLEVLIAVLKAVIALVQEVEVPGFGPEKKQAVLDLIGALYDANPAWHGVPKETVLKLAAVAIDVIVAFFNLIGRFKHSQPAPAPSQP